MYIQTLIRVLLLTCGMAAVSAAQPYRRQFDDQWKKADEIVREHHQSWEAVFTSLDADSKVCEAIVFPEILRWSKLKDVFEQAALKDRYIKEGTAGADFSIGLFQMKPSFAEKVEKAWMKSPLCREYGLYFDLMDTQEARRRRIERLSDERWQCVYLAVFVRLLEEREPSLSAIPATDLVRLLATAYNRDFEASPDSLRKWSSDRTFHLEILPTRNTKYCSYADIALEWYEYINR